MVTGGEKNSEIIVKRAGNLMKYKKYNQDAWKHKGTFKVPDFEFKVYIYIFFHIPNCCTDGGSEKVEIIYFYGVTVPSK